MDGVGSARSRRVARDSLPYPSTEGYENPKGQIRSRSSMWLKRKKRTTSWKFDWQSLTTLTSNP